MEPKTSIAIERIQNDTLKKSCLLLSMPFTRKKFFIKQEMNILLKPNVLMGKPPERAVTTHPRRVTSEFNWSNNSTQRHFRCRFFRRIGAGGIGKNLRFAVSRLFAKKKEASCTSFEKSESIVYPVINPLIIKEFSGSVLLRDADIIINLPKIKTHEQSS